MSQVQQELANTRQEAEKLSTENESLSKNYESLLKVVERERNDSKAEQEKLNTQIQEFLKELEILRTESIRNKQERCELEKELTGTTTDLDQLQKENSELLGKLENADEDLKEE